MDVIRELEDFATKKIASTIVDLLGTISDENFIRLTYLAEKLTNDKEILAGIRGIRHYLQNPDHAARKLFRRVFDYLPERNRRIIFETLFLRAWFLGNKKRTQFQKEYGYRPPFVMILSPTLNCNLRCKGCYTLGYGTKPELSYEVVSRVLKECEELAIHFITILGGEPLTYPHLLRMIEEHPTIFFQVYTNGTLMTREIAKRFAELGNVMVVISIEGYEEETDRWRGKGVFKKIMSAFEYLREARVLIGSSATVTSQNAEVVASEEFVDFMIECGSFLQNYFLYVPVNGRADFSLMVTPEQRNLLRKNVAYFRHTKPMFFLDFWNDGPHVEGCIAGGRRYFHVNAKGDVEPCVYTHIAYDNIMNTTLKKALNSPLFQAIRKRQPHCSNHLRPCMIIDNPKIMREIIEEVKPYFTHPGAEEIYTVKSKEMDEYAEAYRVFADKIWEEEYLKKQASCANVGGG
ncbi:MAG: radical SAM protein [Desulfobacterota bacterium]|nr:radical SAM protein [Thermodesulfobacteriota bacterium]MDW8002296.1 radical SAM protein [Deltaproteobacteria bacterium]